MPAEEGGDWHSGLSQEGKERGEQEPSGEGGQGGCREVVDFPRRVSGGRRRARGGVVRSAGPRPRPSPRGSSAAFQSEGARGGLGRSGL